MTEVNPATATTMLIQAPKQPPPPPEPAMCFDSVMFKFDQRQGQQK